MNGLVEASNNSLALQQCPTGLGFLELFELKPVRISHRAPRYLLNPMREGKVNLKWEWTQDTTFLEYTGIKLKSCRRCKCYLYIFA